MRVPRLITSASPLLVLLAAACSSDLLSGVSRAPTTVSLMVTNSTCTTGTCSVVQVYAFPNNPPTVPGGRWHFLLGTVTGSSTCLAIPPKAIFVVAAVDAHGVISHADTTTWTTYDGVALGSTPPSPLGFMAGSSTDSFVPSRAGGWSVTLPGSAAPSPAAACTPTPLAGR